MNRRNFLQSALAGSVAALARPARMLAAIPKMKIKRIRFYHNPLSKTLFNQSFHVVTVETDQGLTGIGEGDRGTPLPISARTWCGQRIHRSFNELIENRL